MFQEQIKQLFLLFVFERESSIVVNDLGVDEHCTLVCDVTPYIWVGCLYSCVSHTGVKHPPQLASVHLVENGILSKHQFK